MKTKDEDLMKFGLIRSRLTGHAFGAERLASINGFEQLTS